MDKKKKKNPAVQRINAVNSEAPGYLAEAENTTQLDEVSRRELLGLGRAAAAETQREGNRNDYIEGSGADRFDVFKKEFDLAKEGRDPKYRFRKYQQARNEALNDRPGRQQTIVSKRPGMGY